MKILRFSSVDMCRDLFNLGIPKNKSVSIKFPTFLNEDLIHHFIRGYFDGNGCIWSGKRKRMVVKDSKVKLGRRERIIHNVKFTITGCNDIVKPS